MDTPNPLVQQDSRPDGRSFFTQDPDQLLQVARADYNEQSETLDFVYAFAFSRSYPVLTKVAIRLTVIEQGNFERRIRDIKRTGTHAGALVVKSTNTGGESYHETL